VVHRPRANPSPARGQARAPRILTRCNGYVLP
jgi:hypothetical protein